jgi:hypothetical protein
MQFEEEWRNALRMDIKKVRFQLPHVVYLDIQSVYYIERTSAVSKHIIIGIVTILVLLSEISEFNRNTV